MALSTAGEYITYYDFVRHMRGTKLAYPVTELVLDFDHGLSCLCRCGQNGSISTLAGEPAESAQDIEALWDKRLTDLCGEEAVHAFYSSQAQELLRDYYDSERAYDCPVAPELGISKSCSELDEAFQEIAKRLDDLVQRGLAMARSEDVLEEDLRIITVGRLAGIAPAQYALRKSLDIDWGMADPRIADLTSEEMQQAKAEGEKLYREAQTHELPEEIGLLCLGPDGSEHSVPLAAKGSLISAESEPQYGEPFLAAAGDEVCYYIGQARQKFTLLDGFVREEQGVGLVEAACTVRDGNVLLLVRNTDAPENVQAYPIPIEQ